MSPTPGNRILLDTNAFIAIVNGDPDLGRVRLLPSLTPCLSVSSVAELTAGALKSRQSEANLTELRKRFDALVILEIDRPCADWIAAVARRHDLPLLTRDRHFLASKSLNLLSW